MKKLLAIFAVLFFSFTAISLQAQTAATDSVKKKSFWETAKGDFKLGISDFKGNTNKTDVSTELKLRKSWEKNSIAISVGGVYSENQSVKLQEKYFGSLLDELKFHSRVGAYGKYSFLRDQFAGYDWVNQIGAGLLLTAVENAKGTFKARVGYEYRTENFTPNATGDPANYNSNTGKAGFRAEWMVMENIKFSAEANYQVDFKETNNYFADGFAKFVLNVNKLIDVEIGYSLDYKNLPPEGKKALDRRFDTAIKMKF